MKRKKWLAAACVVALLCSAAGFAEGQLYKENALASYYGEAFQGRPTSSGEIFDMYAMTAAHKTLPFGTMLEVTNLENGNSVVVRVNDRGPFVADREIDLSQGAAEKLGMITAGVARVSISILSEPGKETEAAPAGLPENEEVPAVAAAPRPDPVLRDAPRPEPRPEPVLRDGPRPEPRPEPVLRDGPRPEPRPEPALRDGPRPEPRPEPALRDAPRPEPRPEPALRDERRPEPRPEPVLRDAPRPEPGAPVWRIQLGSFAREENALRMVRSLRAAGLDPAYERHEGAVRVVLAGIEDRRLEDVKHTLQEAGFRDYILRRER